MMMAIERFMASAMSLVRIAPEAPTRAPPMMRTGLPRTNPAMATAMPVNELSSEMTTGMSAPPIGSVIVTPKTRAAIRMTAITGRLTLPDHRNSAPAIVINASAMVTSWPPGTRTGREGVILRPNSLPDAMSEPVKVIEPITMSSTVATFSVRPGTTFAPANLRYSSIAMRAAAPPPTALNSDTSWGIAVIFTVRAVYRP